MLRLLVGVGVLVRFRRTHHETSGLDFDERHLDAVAEIELEGVSTGQGWKRNDESCTRATRPTTSPLRTGICKTRLLFFSVFTSSGTSSLRYSSSNAGVTSPLALRVRPLGPPFKPSMTW